MDPYKTLGVSHDADEKEIKRAHRRLVLEHHPDRAHGKEGVEVKFIAIQEAYEILTGRRRNPKVDSGSASGWDFHDWFWRFKYSRRAGGGATTAQAPPPPEEQRERLREQLSGLRAKAAAKRAAASRRPAHAAQATNPTKTAASSVRHSTTKTARTTQQKPASSYSSASIPSASNPSSYSASTDEEKEEEEQQTWRLILSKAVHHVQDLHLRHNHSVTTHAQCIQSHISSIGSNLSQRLQFHSLHELVPELTNNDRDIEFSKWKPKGFPFPASATIGNAFGHQIRDTNSADAGVPSDNGFQMLFSNSLHHQSREKSAVGAAASRGGNASKESKREGHPRMDAHSRKFADKERVKSRLTTQLTGLKRKKQLKREFDGWN